MATRQGLPSGTSAGRANFATDLDGKIVQPALDQHLSHLVDGVARSDRRQIDFQVVDVFAECRRVGSHCQLLITDSRFRGVNCLSRRELRIAAFRSIARVVGTKVPQTYQWTDGDIECPLRLLADLLRGRYNLSRGRRHREPFVRGCSIEAAQFRIRAIGRHLAVDFRQQRFNVPLQIGQFDRVRRFGDRHAVMRAHRRTAECQRLRRSPVGERQRAESPARRHDERHFSWAVDPICYSALYSTASHN